MPSCPSKQHACGRSLACAEGVAALDVSHLGKGSVEFFDDFGINLECIATSILAVVLLLDVDAGFTSRMTSPGAGSA